MPVLLLLQMDVPFLERWITFSCLWGKGLLLFAPLRTVSAASSMSVFLSWSQAWPLAVHYSLAQPCPASLSPRPLNTQRSGLAAVTLGSPNPL